MAVSYTKKFKEFDEDYNPKYEDYVVGYREYDEAEVRIPLVALDNIIIANKYVRKDIDDYANGLLTFNKGYRTSGDVMSTVYLQGLNGWRGTPKGDFEMNSITLREFLEVPELRKNKITVMGNQFWFTDSALIKSAVATGNSQYDIYFKLEEDEYASFELNDVLKGIYHYDNGFWTVYLRVYELILDPDTTGEIGVRVVSLNGKDPRKSMLLVRTNNFTDTERQGSIYADGIRKYIRVLDGFDPENPTSEGSISTVKLQIGDLSTITNHPVFGDLNGYGLYGENVYLSGKIIVKNNPDESGQLLGVYRGYWNANTNYYQYDQATYDGSLFTSKQINNKGNKPTGYPDDEWWEVTVARGQDGESDPGLTIELTNENHMVPTDREGKNPSYGGAYTTVYILKGSTDITDLYSIESVLEYPTDLSKVQFTRSDNTVTLSYIADDIDAAVIRFKATAEGYPPLTIDWKITKLKTGLDGQDATSYWLVTDAPVIKKMKTGLYEPSPFVVRAFKQTGAQDVTQYQGYIKLEYGTEIDVVAGAIYQFVPKADVESYTLSLFADANLRTLLDKEIVHVVEDGQDGVNGEAGPQGPSGADGLQGPSIVFAGNWAGDKQYWAYSDSQTCVYFNGKYFYSKTVAITVSPIKIPAGDENNPESEVGKLYWNEFVGQFDNIATGLLLAERIASSELSVNKIFIVDRDEISGNIITKDGSIITKQEEKDLSVTEIIGRLNSGWYLDQGVIRSIAAETVNGELIPKVMLDKDGKLKAIDVNITGTMTINDGFIGNLEVYKDALWQSTVNGPFPASSGFYYLRKTAGVTITPQGHLIGKDYFLSGDSTQGPSVFIGDVYLPGSWQTEDNSLISIMNYWASLFEKVLVGSQYMIKAKLPLFSVGDIVAYGSEDTNVPSIWEGLPVDKVTIDFINGKLSVIGGVGEGGIKAISIPAMNNGDAFNNAILNTDGDIITFDKSNYVNKIVTDWQTYNVDLGSITLTNIVTLNTHQTISGLKTFTTLIKQSTFNNELVIGSKNSEYIHFESSNKTPFYFNTAIKINGDIVPNTDIIDLGTNMYPFNAVYTRNWFISLGNTGWFNQTYAGGIYMEDFSFVRIYNDKQFYVANSSSNAIEVNGGIYLYGTNGNGLKVIGTEATTTTIYGKIGSNVNEIIAKYEVAWYNDTFSINTYRGASINLHKVSFSFANVDKFTFYTNGDFLAAGEITAYSDYRLKRNINNMHYRGRLIPKTYIKNNKLSIGFIAQDVQLLYPELVIETDTKEKYLSLNYSNITAVLSAQINNVEDEVTILKKKIVKLENQIAELTNESN